MASQAVAAGQNGLQSKKRSAPEFVVFQGLVVTKPQGCRTMHYRITGLSPDLFSPLFGLNDQALAAACVTRHIADFKPGFPDRIEMRDAEPGVALLLLNYQHQPANTPYRSSHAIFVREGAVAQYDAVDEIPEVMLIRPISLRAFNSADLMVGADLADGCNLDSLIKQFLEKPDVAYLHAHYAKPGCFAARINRLT